MSKPSWEYIALVGVLIGGAVLSQLFVTGQDRTMITVITAALAAVLGPLVANGPQNDKLEEIDRKTEQVKHQTNGMLEEKITRIVRTELAAFADQTAGTHRAPDENPAGTHRAPDDDKETTG